MRSLKYNNGQHPTVKHDGNTNVVCDVMMVRDIARYH